MSEAVSSVCGLEVALQRGLSFEQLCDDFTWSVPEHINVAEQVCTRHADVAAVMQQAGVNTGDRVAVILPQRVETALVHLAAQRLGAVSLPLSILFGDDALQYRLQDSGASFLVVAADRYDLITTIQPNLSRLATVLVVAEPGPISINASGQGECDSHTSAFLLYTSGTTGPPKGALVPHRALLGNLTGFECSHNGFPQADDVMFTPADWAWTGGLLDEKIRRRSHCFIDGTA